MRLKVAIVPTNSHVPGVEAVHGVPPDSDAAAYVANVDLVRFFAPLRSFYLGGKIQLHLRKEYAVGEVGSHSAACHFEIPRGIHPVVEVADDKSLDAVPGQQQIVRTQPSQQVD